MIINTYQRIFVKTEKKKGVIKMNIIVYCGASKGNKKEYENSAIQLGEWIAKGSVAKLNL